MSKRKTTGLIAAMCIALIIACTGCAGISWGDMKEQGASLLEQGGELNKELSESAAEVNREILSSDTEFRNGWKSILEEKENLRIQYADWNNIKEKKNIEDFSSFVEALHLEEWKLTEGFPEGVKGGTVFFVQEPVNDKKTEGKYKNIANVRCFPEEGYVTITVAKGLIDLSESFEPQNDNFTSVYQVPEEVIEYLETCEVKED